MTQTVACDVSEFQVPVNDAYPHEWLIFRICDGTYRDQHFVTNYAWSRQAAKSGDLAGYSGYCVFRPGVDVHGTAAAMLGKIDAHVTVMIDVESWGGQIHGDHSAEITALAERFAALLGDKRRVLAYGNQGDLASIYPHRPPWLKLVVAGYGSVQPSVPNMIGWQYSDGQDKWAVPVGLSRSSAPFGRCDHNVFPGLAPADLAAALGVGTRDPMEDVMAMYKDKAAFEASLKQIVETAVNDRIDNMLEDYDGTPSRIRTYLNRVGPNGYDEPTTLPKDGHK